MVDLMLVLGHKNHQNPRSILYDEVDELLSSAPGE
eukprot:CAMPEP_0117740170 /NCGR_PEP_ID=MMETSP0947-20121206/4188_1 /TAXON_ID=44440 /ORGANISM="Chattonella subsalsa, Strain CCMP2191" /LENGTH=34 /DNA_ID= /DNA_START= /DNA_END= /DNA_ORIENTATION=